MAQCCTVCCDDEVELKFECATVNCDYRLCSPCLVRAFEDCSGNNSRDCPLCKAPTALDMAIAQIGKGGVMAVERELRPSVEHQVRQELSRKEGRKKDASEINETAIQLYNQVVELLNLKCPRCKLAFYDYEGCNSLRCANNSCKASFCAICLKDCDNDAHPHVREAHGDLYDMDMFHATTKQRQKQIVVDFLKELRAKEEPFDLIQSVTNLLRKGDHTAEDSGAGLGANTRKAELFIQAASQDLERMIGADRLSLLGDDNGMRDHGISRDNISPRCTIPDDIEVSLVPDVGNEGKEAYQVDIRVQLHGRWRNVEGEELKELVKKGEIPSSSVDNVQQGLRCAVVAFEGERKLYQVECLKTLGPELMVLRFSSVDKEGGIQLAPLLRQRRRILAFNPNQRITMLQDHVQKNVTSTNLPLPLKHLIGVGQAMPVLTNLVETVEESVLASLNTEQLKAAHPLNLKTAGEVAGPPGTGKTQTISAIVRSLLNASEKNIVVLSERNGAIDAIADKFLSSCFDKKNGKLSKLVDMNMWMNILTFGAPEAIGTNTKEFLVPQKMQWHPELLEAKKIEERHKNALDQRAGAMRSSLADEVKGFGDKFDDDNAWSQHVHIQKNLIACELTSPSNIIASTEKCLADLLALQGSGITETSVADTVSKNSTLLVNLFAVPRTEVDIIRFGTSRDQPSWNKREVSMRVKNIVDRFKGKVRCELFEAEGCREVEMQWRQAQENRQKVETRVSDEMQAKARLKMSTIGSSHKLFAISTKDQNNEDDDLAEELDVLSLNEGDEEDAKEGTIVIFDESGCIPSYELLGLSRLGCEIDAILVVGDKHQLPPFNPDNGGKPRFDRSARGRQRQEPQSKKLSSLLDVSAVTVIKLTTQYRVPRDIADILNARIYNGNYRTPSDRGIPNRGLTFQHIPYSQDPRRKYVNPNEVNQVLELLREKVAESRSGNVSVIVLTPYKNQQREIKFQLKRASRHSPINVPEDRILTIDQCQGQEADFVILSLVQRPTRFLDKHRLTVALSRTKKELIILGDRTDFRKASENADWDCKFLAQDIMSKTGTAAFL